MQTFLQPQPFGRLHRKSQASRSPASVNQPVQRTDAFTPIRAPRFGVDDKVYVFGKKGILTRYIANWSDLRPDQIMEYLFRNYGGEIWAADKARHTRLTQAAIAPGGLFDRLKENFGEEIAQGGQFRVANFGDGGGADGDVWLAGTKNIFPSLRDLALSEERAVLTYPQLSEIKDPQRFRMDLVEFTPASIEVMQRIYKGVSNLEGVSNFGPLQQEDLATLHIQSKWSEFQKIIQDAAWTKNEPWSPSREEVRDFLRSLGHDPDKMYLGNKTIYDMPNRPLPKLGRFMDNDAWLWGDALEFATHANIIRGSVLKAPRDTYHMVTSHFVLCSIFQSKKKTERGKQHDFNKIVTPFVKSAKIGGGVAGSLMVRTKDWPAGSATLPASDVTKEMAEKAFAKAGAKVKIEEVNVGGVREENDHGMLIFYGIREGTRMERMKAALLEKVRKPKQKDFGLAT
jgi:hypothetical protein